jgi:DNA polymerase elongation subunit (family B)
MTRLLALDIETVPLPAAATLPYPESDRTPPSNYKSDDAIARWREKDRAEWAVGLAKDAALSPRTGRVAAVGLVTGRGDDLSICTEDERLVLAHTVKAIREADVCVTWNGLTFDFPFLAVRAAILGVDLPGTFSFAPYLRRYVTRPHCDVRAILTQWDSRAKGTLGDWLTAFGLPPKTGHGSDVAALWAGGQFDAIRQYAADDAVRELALYRRVAPYYGIDTDAERAA